MNLRGIGTLYRRELLSALRERSIVVNSILIPVFLYPVLLWVMFNAIVFVSGLSREMASRVAILNLPSSHSEIRDSLLERGGVEIDDSVASLAEGVEKVRGAELDAIVEFLPPASEGAALANNFRVKITYDGSEERSRNARSRVSRAIGEYRGRWVLDEAQALGLEEDDLSQFRVREHNVSTDEEEGNFVLAQMVPFLMIFMVAIGCFYPAIDSTAGERERSTWETLMTVSASRGSVVGAKYLSVATFGLTAGMLNILAMTVSMGAIVRPLLAGRGEAFQIMIPLMAIPVMVLAVVALAMFFAAAMMILAAFARTFKEGQAMIMPVYMMAFIPILFMTDPDLALSPRTALVPVANVHLMVRDAMTGVFHWSAVGVTVLMTGVLIALCLWMARTVLQFEDLLLGSYAGSFWKFAKERLLRRRRGASTKRASR